MDQMIESNPTLNEHKVFLKENVLSGRMRMYNLISKEYINVTVDNVNKIAAMLTLLDKGHGTNHLEYQVV
jgi:hypothetical protein